MTMFQGLTGQRLGQYDLKELLGVTNMSAVYLGYQESVSRYVAVKVLIGDLEDPTGQVERFNREARIAAALEHPHIVPIFDFGTQGNINYVVMRLLRGGSLEDRIRERQKQGGAISSLSEASHLLTQIAGALDYAHERNLIHRDIKPSNIMFDGDGRAYLVDFGIAKPLDGGTGGLTVRGISMGTTSYMAPEQWKGDRLTVAVDQYALGVVLYRLVTGQAAYDVPDNSGHVWMYKHLNEYPQPVHELRTDAPPEMSKVIERSMAKKAQERYPTVMGFAEEFENAIRRVPRQSTNFFTFALPPKSVFATPQSTPSGQQSGGMSQPSRVAQQPMRPPLPTQTYVQHQQAHSEPVVLPMRGSSRLVPVLIGLIILLIVGVVGVLLLSSQPPTADTGPTPTSFISIVTNPTGTEAPVTSTEVPTIDPSPTETTVPPTETSVPTSTTIPPSATIEPTAEPVEEEDATISDVVALAVTDTEAPPSSTPRPTETAEPTNTTVPTDTEPAPTDTPRPTATDAPEDTEAPPTITRSIVEVIPPTDTPTRTPTPTPTVDTEGTIEAAVKATTDAYASQTSVAITIEARVTQTAESFTDTPTVTFTPSATASGGGTGLIAFVSNRDGNDEIYLMNSDGSGERRLTTSEGSDRNPAWSPDGTMIAFGSNRDGNTDIYIMNADGSDPVNITNHPSEDDSPTWSADGNSLIFNSTRDGNWELYRIGIADEDVVQLTDTGDSEVTSASAHWSIANDLVTFDSDLEGNYDIYVMNADGSEMRKLTQNPLADTRPAWSPDGDTIVFRAEFDANHDLYILNPDTGITTKITDNAAIDSDGAWSPDGSQIVFWSERDGNRELYLVNADGSDERRLTFNSANDSVPVWQP